MKFAIMLALAVALSGCAGTGTASGRPDVVLHKVDRACVRDTFAGGALSSGYQVRSVNDSQVVLARETTNIAKAVLFGSGNGPPEERLTVTMVPIPGTRDLRVVIDGATVTNPGTAFEDKTAQQFTAHDQASFEAMGHRAEASCPAR